MAISARRNRCLIDHIVVTATKERIDATISWKSGGETPLILWRGIGCYHLIRELHAQGLTVFEIKDHLAAGMTSTGQTMKITVGRLYDILRKIGFKPNRFSMSYRSLRHEAVELNGQGRSLNWIAQYFNERGLKSASGNQWTKYMVYGLIRSLFNKVNILEDTHREAITAARKRGLTYREMAEEFNRRGIITRDGQLWTARGLRARWTALNRLSRERLKKGFTTTAPEQFAARST
jgi:hypothetical protein